ncbi:hypothetical protein T440DRAFT_552367 [Plenodomus tracheiphilus IPT5]|uniref:Uncharacterized protein n=1 Tax=Plenodomus tracheiphilus IPT5 TaxID=1408161 RepID=A0A6A7BE02_9PLEO|nr:hypothetical protein T440DRAFT_552367 [Plenodomus tracheiphilus IPT5]
MAHRVSKLSAGLDSHSYGPVSTNQDASFRGKEKILVSATTTSIRSDQRRSSSQSWSAAQVLLTGAIPLVALIVWLALSPSVFSTFAGAKIGGRLTQAEAKAIDVITGAILAPLVMAALNHIWFDSARVSAVNEVQPNSIPLRTLVATSSTSGGNYDLFNLRDLLQGKSWRLYLFALLTILSAVGRSALSNIIAYEAFSEVGSSATSVGLRLRSDVAVNANLGMSNSLKLQLYDFDMGQNAQVAKDMMALLTDLSYEDAYWKLTDNTYIGYNATSHSLGALSQSIVRLENLPAYRLSVNCTPDLPLSISVTQPLSDTSTQIGLTFNTTATSNDTLFQANYPGVPDNIRTGDDDKYTFAAFSLGYREVYLGHLERFNLTNTTTPSLYGDVNYRAFNMTPWGFTGTQILMSVSGLRCKLYREYGSITTVRELTNATSAGTWNTISMDFPADQEKLLTPSLLSKFQERNLNFHAPGSIMPGLGPALNKMNIEQVGNWGTEAFDTFTNFAHNFLYASGETERIVYEVAAASGNTSRSRPEYKVQVKAFETKLHYRITYIPSILLLGLLCLLGASAVTGGMAAFGWRSFSGRAHRQVNVVRAVLDSVVGLEGDRDDIVKMAQSDNGVVDGWAAGYKVRYTSVDDGDGTMQIMLEKSQR